MAYRYGDRNSRKLFPPSVEELVEENDPVRVYDAFIGNLDFEKLGIIDKENQVGAPPYDPAAMLKLLVYGYSYGIRGSRRLERACYHNISFIWLMGDLKPDHKTICNFRRANRKALKKVLNQCVRLCMKLDLIDGNVLFVDGSKFRANASLNQIWTEERCKKFLEKLDEKIDQLLNECERVDVIEENEPSLVKLKKSLLGKQKLQTKVQSILEELKKEQVSCLNSTDRASVKTKGRQGIHSGYSAELVTDGKHGLIANSDVVSRNNDYGEFSNQIKQAEEVLDKQVDAACGDAGYSTVDDLEIISSRGTQVVVPTRKQMSAKSKELSPFAKENFKYDEENDEYICPVGNRLKYIKPIREKNALKYRIVKSQTCLTCKYYGTCTKAKRGRTIVRFVNEKVKEELEKTYESEEGQKIYALRKQIAELPFGHFKRNLGADHFLLRGLDGVNAEMALLSTNFNISRMITILGVPAILSYLLGGGT
jgi:transposase